MLLGYVKLPEMNEIHFNKSLKSQGCQAESETPIYRGKGIWREVALSAI